MKGLGEKVLGWFIVEEGGEAPSHAGDELDHEETAVVEVKREVKRDVKRPQKVDERPAPPPIAAPSTASRNAPTSTSLIEICRAKGIPHEDCERLRKVLDLLATLPPEAPQEVKRAIVSAALTAFGVPIDQITMTASSAVAAIDAHVAEADRRTSDVVAQAEARIQKLTAEIAEVRRLVDLQRANQRDISLAAASEKSRVQSAIEFFGAARPLKDASRELGPR